MNFIKFHSEKNFIISGVCLSGVCLVRSFSRQEFVFLEFVFQEFVTAPIIRLLIGFSQHTTSQILSTFLHAAFSFKHVFLSCFTHRASKNMDTTFFGILVVLNNFLLIDATDKSQISSDQKRFFIALSLYPLSFFANTPFKLAYTIPLNKLQ